MIERVEVEGRPGSAMYVDERMQPTDAAKAMFYKIVFDDGGQLILNAQSEPKK